jgi:hypothetical protein
VEIAAERVKMVMVRVRVRVEVEVDHRSLLLLLFPGKEAESTTDADARPRKKQQRHLPAPATAPLDFIGGVTTRMDNGLVMSPHQPFLAYTPQAQGSSSERNGPGTNGAVLLGVYASSCTHASASTEQSAFSQREYRTLIYAIADTCSCFCCRCRRGRGKGEPYEYDDDYHRDECGYEQSRAVYIQRWVRHI